MRGSTFLTIVLALLLSTCRAESDESEEVTLDSNPATILYTAKPSTTPKTNVSYDESPTTELTTIESTKEATNETSNYSTTESIEPPTTESTNSSTTEAPRVCSPIQVLYQKIQDELEKIVTEISKFQQEAMSKISANEQQHLLLQQVPASAPAAGAVPARMNLIQLWNMVQQLQQSQQLSASQQLLQQAATISPPVTQGSTSR
ncbi:uncharacterized protein LOC120420622 [Culex pipiens pallens]|uniref:uncharacterized protein LOC120420622 n=1 Tax=Culex pipiens pallens TaxID=42434 RepID=UPI001952E460|nr:uncharacterized protein LOC120420622 [Culex pipiens pallens]